MKSAKRLLYATAIVSSLLTIVFIIVAGLAVIAELRDQATKEHCNVLASAAQSSLHYDLLNSNILQAADRLKTLMSPLQAHSICIKVKSLTSASADTIKVGADDICKSENLLVESRRIFFDQDHREPAYEILVLADSSRMKFQPSRKSLLVIFFSLAIPFFSFVLLAIFANGIFSEIFRVLRTESVAFSEKINFLETKRIIDLITERNNKTVQVEQALSKSRESEALAKLARQVSHDIRSPLSALNMIMASASGLDDERKKIVKSVSQRINDIANQLLERSRQSQASSINELYPLRLTEVIESIVTEARFRFSDRTNIRFNVDLSDGHDVFVTIDATEFGRVLSNLITNSVEAISHQGEISLRLKKTKNHILLTITDNGSGIPEDILKNLGTAGITFGKENSDNSGSGLGVYHAKQTIERFNGQLTYESTPGLGTTAAIRLVIAEKNRLST